MRTTIGERVRTYRLRRGLTQACLAHLVGRSERWLIDVEGGGVDPRLSDALALARELGVGVDDLAGVPPPFEERAGRPPPRPPVLPVPSVQHVLWERLGVVAGGCGA